MPKRLGWICGCLWGLVVFAAGLGAHPCMGQELLGFDFTKAEDCRGWQATHDVTALDATPEGLAIRIAGSDPYINGPARDYPEGQLLWMRLRLKAEQEGLAQIFYYKSHPTEEQSVRLPVRAGMWEEFRVPFPAMGPGYRLRIDPPGSRGRAVVSLLSFEPRMPLKSPVWPKPAVPSMQQDAPRIRSGQLVLEHSTDELGGFVVSVDGRRVGIGLNRGLIGYLDHDQQRWVDLRTAKVTVNRQGRDLVVGAVAEDSDGATWRIAQRFSPRTDDAIDVQTQISVDRDREIVYLPIFGVVAGAGSFGEGKTQALFPGLEYLDQDEPSSSEADIIGPGSKRQVPDSLKITFPLMTVLAEGRYVGLIWEPQDDIAAVFDSPDRLFRSGGHVMGLVYPGSNGSNRLEGNLLPHGPQKLIAGAEIKLKATIIGGRGPSVVEAVKQYVTLRGLPEVPDTQMDLQAYAKVAAAGWLDSKLREGNRYRHAYPGAFQPHPAADAALWMDWLATRTRDEALRQRLARAAEGALGEVDPAAYNSAAVSHVRYPVASLLYGHVAENAARARQQGHALLGRFEADGSVLYRPSRDVDYGKTHFAREANGLTAQLVYALLEAASVSGDPKLITEGLRLLRAMDKFVNTVPRGAQTWECPLHTPDVLASANLVHAYVRGYELSGDAHFLEMARHWAWTGVPFVYLINPANRPVGPYATIAVYGATNWVAPNWMGLPVQWCGLVYADALYQLAEHDAGGPWVKLADGITASGIQQTWPTGLDPERQGLLPDSVGLRTGMRNDPVINPGTVQANAVRLYRQAPVYSFRAFRTAGLLVHAPGRLSDRQEKAGRISFTVGQCMRDRYHVLISGCKKQPRVRINGAEAAADALEYAGEGGWLILHLSGDAKVELITE